MSHQEVDMMFGYRSVRAVFYGVALLTPFTALRFGIIGIGEILLVLAFIMMLILNRGSIRKAPVVLPLFEFWIGYLILVILGFFFNILILGNVSGTFDGAIFDFMAYVTILIVVIILGDERLYYGTTSILFFRNIFFLWGLVYSLLYFLSQFATEIFGFPLRNYIFFAPLVDNVHQAAMITSVMPFVMWHLMSIKNSIFIRVLYFIFGFLFVLMAFESGSTKAMMAIVLGSIMVIIYVALKRFTGHENRFANIISWSIIAFMFIVLLSFNWVWVVDIIIQFFRESDGSSARENLYTLGFNHGLKSFFFGFGPGPHINYEGNSYSDAHNSILAIFLQGGFFAIVLLIVTIIRLLKSISAFSLLFGAFFAVFIYFLGGDILRRLPVWILIIGLMYLSNKVILKK